MKIFGIGLSRTGTKSLTKALNMVGFSVNHFPRDKATIRETKNYIDTGECNLAAAEEFDAVIDMVPVIMMRGLFKKYPDSKFILTIRELDAWTASMEGLYDRVLNRVLERQGHIPGTIGNFIKFSHENIYGTEKFDKGIYRGVFKNYNKTMIEFFKGTNRLLVLDICSGEGWAKLCSFLEKKEKKEKKEKNVPFPLIKNVRSEDNNYEYQHIMR